ncbi:MAG TPA: hypothetical protein VFY06_12615 [Verrucomicrobiae bacterium]|nr:hypothetical protein [Verrucomicrobiae bacterium]
MTIFGDATLPTILSLPERIEVYRADNDIRRLGGEYQTVQKSADGIDASAEIAYGSNVVFHVLDHWSLTGAVVTVSRKVEVTGNAPGGFDSSVEFFLLGESAEWTNVNFLIPGALYGDPTYDGARSPGGTLNYAAHRLIMREDILPAPMFGISFSNGASLTMLDPAPRGDTTEEETRLAKPVIIDARLQFGALGVTQNSNGPIVLSFTYPGTSDSLGGGRGGPPGRRWIRRYHPITQGFTQSYRLSFRFGQNESFRDLTRNSWRWAWNTLKPPIYYINVAQMRRVLIDNVEAQVNTIDGRTAMPFVVYTLATNKVQWNYTMVAMGFVGKDIECADQLLREGDRDQTERGQKMRQSGLAIISTLIKALPTVPLQGTGFDLATGKPWTGEHQEWVAPWLRNATESMRVLMRAYRREKALGREHPEWFNWVKQYVDWLILQQRKDGSFPRRWVAGSNEVAEPTGTTSYAPVPLLVLMTKETGDPQYQQAAIRAADYIWTNFGSRGFYVGGASDNPNITDKEAGMLSMEAFLSLYDATKESKWLERAEAAANYAETWIWIWQVPMPVDATNAQLDWKKSAPAIGFQGITAMNSGSVDEYLDWAVPSYAKLYNLTKDPHYLDVARLLLHDTKQMVSLPGREYDMRGTGWQQEGWRMGPGGAGRGVGGHRFWLPWISANHLYGITGLEEYDPALFKELSTKPEPESK